MRWCWLRLAAWPVGVIHFVRTGCRTRMVDRSRRDGGHRNIVAELPVAFGRGHIGRRICVV